VEVTAVAGQVVVETEGYMVAAAAELRPMAMAAPVLTALL
jgi:hypothetical protein